jgi:hypothetical protein
MRAYIAEVLAHLGCHLGCGLAVLQAPLFDGLSLDPSGCNTMIWLRPK